MTPFLRPISEPSPWSHKQKSKQGQRLQTPLRQRRPNLIDLRQSPNHCRTLCRVPARQDPLHADQVRLQRREDRSVRPSQDRLRSSQDDQRRRSLLGPANQGVSEAPPPHSTRSARGTCARLMASAWLTPAAGRLAPSAATGGIAMSAIVEGGGLRAHRHATSSRPRCAQRHPIPESSDRRLWTVPRRRGKMFEPLSANERPTLRDLRRRVSGGL